MGVQLYPNNHKTNQNILKPDTSALGFSEQKMVSMSFCSIVREVPSQLEILTPLVLQVADYRCGGFLQIRLTPGQVRPCSQSFLKEDFHFHWSIIALQCWVCFCRTTVRISCVCTYVPFSWSPQPSPAGPHRAARWALHSAAGSLSSPVLHMVVCIHQRCSLSPSHPPLPRCAHRSAL